MKLDQEQREIVIGLLLGGVRIESDEERRNHSVQFEFNENSAIRSSLKMHIHERFYEWLTSCKSDNEENEVPFRFSTIIHSLFGLLPDQFLRKGQLLVPKLIHRWLSQHVLAYWNMYGGFRINSGDILPKIKTGNHKDVERVVKEFQIKSLACKVKTKRSVFWIGLQENNVKLFQELVELYLLKNVVGHLTPSCDERGDIVVAGGNHDFYAELDSDEQGLTSRAEKKLFIVGKDMTKT